MVLGYVVLLRANRLTEEAIANVPLEGAPPARQLAANDIAIQRGGEPVESIIRFHSALRELSGRRGIRDDVSRYEAMGMALVDTSAAKAGLVDTNFPPADSPLRLEQFFKTMYLRYDERYVYSAPNLKNVKIVAQIEAGAGEFNMPWHRPGVAFTIPRNALTEARYRGSNILWLWMDADEKKFEHQVWATYKQWQELGAQVRGEEKSTLIVKYGEWVPKEARDKAKEASDDPDDHKRLYAKPAHVFNIDQVDAPAELRSKLLPPDAPRPDLTTRLAHVDAYLAATGAEFREGGQRAFYRLRIPTKPARHSNRKPATDSDLKAAGVPI